MNHLKPRLGVLCLLLASTLAGISTSAQSQRDPFLDRLSGTWQGEGKTLGMAARSELKWEWVLGEKFMRLTLRNEMKGANEKPQLFEGHAYYRGGAGKYEARWFDLRGLSFPIRAQLDGDALVAEWGSPDQEEGKSVYRLLAPGRLEVIDSVKQKNGNWKEFGRFTLVRQ